MDLTVGQRLSMYLERTNRNQKEITDITGIRKENVSNWINGLKPIPNKHVVKILINYKDLSARWLLTGEGEMFENILYVGKKSRKILKQIKEKFNIIYERQEEMRKIEIEAIHMIEKFHENIKPSNDSLDGN